MAVDGTTFGLVDNWDQLKLPPTVSGKTLGAVLLLAAADGQIRGKGRVAASVITEGYALHPS